MRTDNSDRPVTVLGAGSFGTVIAGLAGARGAPVRLWMRSERQLAELRDTSINSRYVPKYVLPAAVTPTGDLAQAVRGTEIVFVAVPSKAVHSVVAAAAPYADPDTLWVSLTKGIAPDGFKLMSDVLREILPQQRIGVLSGPNLAREIAAGQLAGAVIASPTRVVRERVCELLSNSRFRVYRNPDMYGVELGGALKNIYAIAAGMGAALDMGENTRALLLTRSLAEMSRLAVDLGADPTTFIGLAGMGDLMVTCSSPLSRNYRVGYALGQGHTLRQAVQQLGETAEGVNTLRVVAAEARRRGVYMPLVSGLYAIVHEGAAVERTIRQLMSGENADDVEFRMHKETV